MNTNMTAEEQRIKIAEACGWRFIPQGYDHDMMREHWVDQQMIPKTHPPDYLNCLNAIHEAEKILLKDKALWQRYKHELWLIFTATPQFVEQQTGALYGDDMLHATANQRATAFLRAIGQWK